MNLQNIWRWLKGTRQGKFVLLLVAFLIVLYFVSIRSPARKVKPDNRAIAAKAAEPATKAEGYRLKTNIPEPGAATGPSPTPFARPTPATVNTARPSPTPAPLPMRILLSRGQYDGRFGRVLTVWSYRSLRVRQSP